MSATFVPFEANTPKARFVVGVIRAAVADLFADLASEAEVVLSIVVQDVVFGGAWPHPVAILRVELEDDDVGSFVGHLEGRVSCSSRPGPCPNDQQKTEKECC